MNLREMNAVVSDELGHIPKSPEPQNMLRVVYSSLRKHSLGKKAQVPQTKEHVLQRSIAIVKEKNPAWNESYDRDFFRL
jgi:hypothetical protein